MFLSRFFSCLDIQGAAGEVDCGVMAKLFKTGVLKELQTSELLAAKRPWSRAMATALSHFVTFRSEQAAQDNLPVTSVVQLIVMSSCTIATQDA
jgi:hypothetical protein